MSDEHKTTVTPAPQGVAGKLRGKAAFVRSEERGWEWFAASLERLAAEHEAEVGRLRAAMREALDEIEDAGPKALKYAGQALRKGLGNE
jgi:hypothetical protein